MSISIDNIVKVHIDISNPTVDRVDFNKALIFSDEITFSDGSIVKEASDHESLMTMGIFENGSPITEDSDIYQAARTFCTPKKRPFLVGGASTSEPGAKPVIYKIELDTSGGIEGVNFSFSYTQKDSQPVGISVEGKEKDTEAKILSALLAELNKPEHSAIEASMIDNSIRLQPKTPQDGLLLVASENIEQSVKQKAVPAGKSTEGRLNAIKKRKNFYFLASPQRDVEKILERARWSEANLVMHIAASNQADILNPNSSTDLASNLSELRFNKTALIYSSYRFTDIGWLSSRVDFEPSAAKWAYSELTGIQTDDLNEDQFKTLLDKKANAYLKVAGRPIVMGGGVTSSGRHIDLQIGVDWQTETVKKDMLSLLISNAKKIDFDDNGIAIIYDALNKSLKKGLKHFSRSYEIEIPTLDDFSPEQRKSRKFDKMPWSVVAKSGVQEITLQGSLTY